MALPHSRAAVSAPAFVRRLARLGEVELPPSGPGLSDRLGQWLDWNRAVALSRALDSTPSAGTPCDPAAEEAACVRARATLAAAITRPEAAGSAAEADFAPFRRKCLDLQRAMQASTGQLRGRLRDALAKGSAEQARLAEVDAVMEMTLSPREQSLLAATPALLGQHFDRLKQANADTPGDAWLGQFRLDLQDVLLAELDVRFHPIDALLVALRSSPVSGTP